MSYTSSVCLFVCSPQVDHPDARRVVGIASEHRRHPDRPGAASCPTESSSATRGEWLGPGGKTSQNISKPSLFY